MTLTMFHPLTARPRNVIWLLAMMLLLLAASLVRGIGCGRQEELHLVPVAGRITLDGRPLIEAVVCFRSKDREFRAMTDNDGRYQVVPGIVPGEYRVDVATYAESSQTILAMDPAATPPSAVRKETPQSNKQNVPGRYRDPLKTELHLTVTPTGADDADFSLTTN